jgi:3-oxoacyl-[acyl-carrier-protein] synthase-3
LPEGKLTNIELAECFDDWTEEKIFKKVGIKERRVAEKDEFVSDLAEKAAKKLFNRNDIDPSSIDFIILCTQSPDYLIPTTACILQDKLNIPTTSGALDFNLGCSGFVYGISLAKSLLYDGTANNVLLIMSETYTKHINFNDKSTRTIFGDGAAAILLKNDSEKPKIGKFIFGTDGKGAENLIIHSSGMKLKKSESSKKDVTDKYGNTRTMENLYMNGPKVFEFVMEYIPPVVLNILEKNDMKMDEVDLFVFHQASAYMLEKLRRKIKIPKEKFFVCLENFGNTVSASIPIALKEAEISGKLIKGQKVMILGFGVGYSWAGTIIEY